MNERGVAEAKIVFCSPSWKNGIKLMLSRIIQPIVSHKVGELIK
jgi:molybdopterin biosynthesis enzyme MoaB